MADSIQQLAASAGEWFETKQREGGDSFVTLKDGRPDWLQELVHAAHGDDFLPDDWRYRWAMDALEFISESDDPTDGQHDFADAAVDVYIGRRITWLGSNLNRVAYCDEAAIEYGVDDRTGIGGRIGLGQYYEASEVYALVLEALEAIDLEDVSAPAVREP